jgi:hypothetical protein
MDSINEDHIHFIITNLKIIGMLKVDEKLCIRKNHLQIDRFSHLQSIKRWFNRDSRDFILMFIKELIKNIINLDFEKYTDKENVLTKILVEMEQAKIGIVHLKKTYSDDPIMFAILENIHNTFCELIQKLNKKLNSLPPWN